MIIRKYQFQTMTYRIDYIWLLECWSSSGFELSYERAEHCGSGGQTSGECSAKCDTINSDQVRNLAVVNRWNRQIGYKILIFRVRCAMRDSDKVAVGPSCSGRTNGSVKASEYGRKAKRINFESGKHGLCDKMDNHNISGCVLIEHHWERICL